MNVAPCLTPARKDGRNRTKWFKLSRYAFHRSSAFVVLHAIKRCGDGRSFRSFTARQTRRFPDVLLCGVDERNRIRLDAAGRHPRESQPRHVPPGDGWRAFYFDLRPTAAQAAAGRG